MRYILIIFGLLLFLGWSVPSLKWGLEVAEAQVALRDGDASQLAEVIGGPAPLRWWQRRKDFNDTVNTSFLSDERFVSIELEMPFAELLAAGEPIPDPVFREVYAAARAPSRLIRLCAEVLDTLAVTCDVAKPRARVKDDGRTTLQGNLRFIPADAPGDLARKGLRPVRLNAALTRGVEVPFTAEGRRKALTNARLLCKSLRSVAGNCVVTRVSLSEARGTRRSGAGLLDARAQLTVHADPAEIDRKTLEATLARLTPMLMY